MATRMELPTRREYSGEKEEQASKKAKREEEAGSVDEIMADNFAEEEAKNARREEEEKEKEKEKEKGLRSTFRDLEYKLFSQAYGDSNRADKISSEEDARRLFTGEEWKMFSEKEWHIQPTPRNFDNYQRLAIYTDVDDEFYWMYADLHYPYAFDRQYLEFAKELNETIKWGTTMSGVRAIAEQIWRKHIVVPSLDGLGPFDTDIMMLQDESNVRAISVSTAKQSGKELVPLFLDLYKRMADGEDFVPALRTIITANGVESYPVNKASIENFLENPDGYSNMLTAMNRCFQDYMEGARNEGYSVNEHICRYFERNVNYGYDYIDYIKEKIRVARKLKIILTDDLVLE